MKKRNAQYADTEISYFELIYGDYYKKWENEKDDRKLFCNLYNMIIEALTDLRNTDDIYIRFSVSKQINSDKSVMDDIIQEFVLL